MIIKTKLLQDSGIDYLEFIFDNGNVKRVNINDSSDNSVLKSVFNEIIKLAMNSDVTLDELDVDPSIGGGLLADVFSEYILDLGQEINRIRAELRADQDDDAN